MGFWDVTKRMLQGKPAFEMPPPDKGGWEEPADEADKQPDDLQGGDRIHRNQRIDSNGNKVIPEAEIVEVRPRYSGQYIELWVTIRNQSQIEVMLDKSFIFGVKQELDYPLPAGGQRDFLIYRGERRKDNGYKYAELYYRDEGSGDYFCAAHMIGYRHETDGTYDISALSLVRPIKDV